MDVTPLLEVKPAPRAVFNRLATHGDRPRFFRRDDDGGWHAVTWNAFADHIRHVALHLASAGLEAGDRVAIYAHNSVEWAAAALGIQAAGGVMVPVYPASTSEQTKYVLTHSDARFLFVGGGDCLARVRALGDDRGQVEQVILLEDPAAAADLPGVVLDWSELTASGRAVRSAEPERFDDLLDAVTNDQYGIMLYTSGTSGVPKGVPLTHHNVGVNARDWLVCNGPLLHEDAVDPLWLPLSHIFGFGEMCLGNTLGFTTYMTDPRAVLGELPEIRPTVFMSVPAYWEKLTRGVVTESTTEAKRAALAKATGGRLRFCLSGGAGLKREIKELFLECGLLIIEGYGLTETAPSLTLNRPDDYRFDAVGKPLPSVELKLGPDGEILAKGPNVFRGYHKNPEATAAAFTEDGWFKTGDLGRLTEDGFLQIVGRKKEILVTAGGKNVPPANIELPFCDDPLIEHLVVYGDGKKYLVAGVWVNLDAAAAACGGSAPSDDQLDSLIQQRVDAVNGTLARFETIRKFRVMRQPLTVEDGHLTSSLKLRRKAVYEAFRDQFEGLYA